MLYCQINKVIKMNTKCLSNMKCIGLSNDRNIYANMPQGSTLPQMWKINKATKILKN